MGILNRTGRLFITFIVTAGAFFLIVFLLMHIVPAPPVYEVNNARLALASADRTRAASYSGMLFSDAMADYDSAMVKWQRENEKFIFLRNYDMVKVLAGESERKAHLAKSTSLTNSDYLRDKLIEEIDSIRLTEELIDSLFGRYPFAPEVRVRISNGKLLLKEGYLAYRDSDFLTANTRVINAGYLLNSVFENTVDELKVYFKSFPEWDHLTQTAINNSRKNNNCSVIIDKISKKCFVYVGGIKKNEFDVELGRNWIGAKRIMGDKATPEGSYRIIRKYQGGETIYYKSLSLDYPNSDDQIRFRKDIADGNLPAASRIGGGIEIHGNGGKGVDWTDGCIALKDSEMDILFALVKTGTPVTIVGSTKSINEILLNQKISNGK